MKGLVLFAALALVAPLLAVRHKRAVMRHFLYVCRGECTTACRAPD